jgi:tetratricopeptide (TPR) repeat protein
MKVNREQGLFLLTLAFLGWLSQGFFDDSGNLRVGTAKGRDLPARPALDPARSAVGKGGYALEGRSPFAPPRDTRPLPPLPLDPPPLDAPPVLAPPGSPSTATKRFGQFYRIAYAPMPEAAPADPNLNGGAPPEDPPASAPADPPVEDRRARAEGLKKQYDWIRAGLGYDFGYIVNPDRYRLRETARAAEPLRFVPYDPAKNRQISSELQVSRDRGGQPLEFGFADTLANRIEQRFVELRYTSGGIPDLLEFAEWCLDKGIEESKAFERAEHVYREVIRLDPGDPAGSLGLGRLLERAFRLEQAWAHYQEMAQGPFKQRAMPRVRLGVLAARLGLPERAEQEFREAIRLESSVPEAHEAYGEFLLAQARVEEALPECEAALRLEPSAAPARARIRCLLGRARLAAGDPEGGMRAFDQALEAVSGDRAALAGKAACAYALGDFSAATESATRGISAGAATPQLYLARGLARMRAGFGLPAGEGIPLLREAEADLRASSQLDPLRTGPGLAALGFLLDMTGRSEEALDALDRAHEADPTDPYTLYLRGRLLRRRGEIDAAKESLSQALEVELDFPDALAERGMVAVSEERMDDAHRFLVRTASLSPKEPFFRILLGMGALLRGDIRAAEEHLGEAIKLDRDSGTARNGLGVCAYARGDTTGALKQFAEVKDRFKNRPDSPHVRYATETFDRINEHKDKVEQTDDFERNELRRGWIEEPEAGLVIKIVNGKVKIEGTATREGEARVYREIDARDFVSFEATLEVGGENQAQFCGLFVSAESAGGGKVVVNFRVDLARTRDGEVQYRITTNPREGPQAKPAPPGISWKTGTPVRISIERAGSAEDPRLRITLDGEPVYDNTLREFRGVTGKYKLGVFGQMEGAGRTADISMDDVRLVYRKS